MKATSVVIPSPSVPMRSLLMAKIGAGGLFRKVLIGL